MRKTVIKFFTIADYEEEEIWLREQHNRGWKLVRMISPCFYIFEACEPRDVIYRLDFRDIEDGYLEMMADFGWEYAGQCFGWNYFRKASDPDASEEDENLFSDNASRAEMVQEVITTRMLPLLLLFLCVIVPNCFKFFGDAHFDTLDMILSIVFGVLFVIYVALLTYCGTKLRKIKQQLEI